MGHVLLLVVLTMILQSIKIMTLLIWLCQTLIVYGCTNNLAENYDSQANYEDGSCNLIYGCTDQNADNYNVLLLLKIGVVFI